MNFQYLTLILMGYKLTEFNQIDTPILECDYALQGVQCDDVFMYVRTYVRTYVCMYVCMQVYTYVCIVLYCIVLYCIQVYCIVLY